MTRRKHRSDNPFLAQMLFRFVGSSGTRCQGANCSSGKDASWEIRFYADPTQALALAEQGVPRSQLDQIVWDAACKEQDTKGVVCHLTHLVCDDCAHYVVSNHAGESATALSMTTTMMTGGSFLLVSDRDTEEAAIAGNFSGDIKESEILEKLRDETHVDIRFGD